MGERYVVTAIATVTFECDGCSGGSQTLTNEPLSGVAVSLKFTPNGVSSPAVNHASEFEFMSGMEFVPPVSGRLELAADTLTSEARRELEQYNRGKCSGLEITQVVLGGLQLDPGGER